MWGIFRSLLKGGVGAVAGAVSTVAGTFAPNAEATAQRDFDESTAARAQYAAEFYARPQSTWWDSFVDGFNRLPRPMMAFGVIGFFVYAMVDPIGFAVRNEALNIIPQDLWVIIGLIVTFYFGVRELDKMRKSKPVVDVVNHITAIEQLRAVASPASTPTADHSDNPALADWAAQALRGRHAD